jgi:hypothetical protein
VEAKSVTAKTLRDSAIFGEKNGIQKQANLLLLSVVLHTVMTIL